MTRIRFARRTPTEFVRVHPVPDVLRRPPFDLDPAAMSRFDDPEGRFAVRYLATTLRGCFVETMARFRPSPRAEALLAEVHGVETGDRDPDRADGLRVWLSVQRVGRCRVVGAKPRLVDVDAPQSLIALDKHPLVRDALDRSGLGSAVNPAHLDTGVIRLSGRIGRPITQAVSRAVYEWFDAHGVGYVSRIDSSERCWALYEETDVSFDIVPLSHEVAEHRHAVSSVAARFEIELPEAWQ